MRKLLTVLLLVSYVPLLAQNYPITSITISLPANPDANTSNWGSGTSMLTITAVSKPVNGRIDPRVQESKMLVSIRKSGAKACGIYTSNNAPTANFTTVTKVWNGSNATSFLGQDCTLPPGEYEICVQFFGYGTMGQTPISDEKCKPFSIRAKEEQVYQPPQNIVPANESSIKELDAKKPITFRWIPVVPKPQEPVTYHLRVWQLMQGQNGTMAVQSNQPIITKDVENLTQAIVTNILTGPCKPPYLCDFAWNVQALNRDGKPVGGNNGTSEVFSFKITPADENIQPPKLLVPKNGDSLPSGQEIRFTWLPPTPTPSTPVTYRIKIVEIKGDESPDNAFRTNKPFFEKDSCCALHTNKPFFEKDSIKAFKGNKPFFEKDSANWFKPGGKYAWKVQAVDREGKAVGGNDGTSEINVFKMMQAGCQGTLKITKDSCLGPDKNGMYKHRMCATYTADPGNTCNILFNNPANNTTNNYGMFQSGQSNIFCSRTPGTSTSNFSPALGSLPSTLAPGASVSFCFDLLAPISYTGVKFTAFGFCDDNSGNYNTANANDSVPLKQCICDPCKELGVTIKNDTIKVKDPAADEVTLFGQLSGLDPNKISKVTIELVYFNIEQTGDKECAKCAENKQWGNFIPPSTAYFSGFTNGTLNGGNFGREWTWVSKVDKDCNGNGHGNGDGGHGDGGVGDPKNLCATCPGGSSKGNDDNRANISPNGNPGDIIIMPGPPIQKINSFSLPISLPPGSSLSCCSDKITVCIRYTWWDFCCHACDVVKCYTFERKPAKPNVNPNPNPKK